MSTPLNQADIYASPCNLDLINRTAALRVNNLLDIGAGTGSNIKLLKHLHPDSRTSAITCSPLEAQRLREIADETFILDLNRVASHKEWPEDGPKEKEFDLVILSHVLEHLQDPAEALISITGLLNSKGLILIALPNICHWRTRLKVARGYFDYEDTGTLDRSHLRFFTYWSAIRLVKECDDLCILAHWPVGGAILGPIRRRLPKSVCDWADHKAVQHWPNIFGFETHILAQKK